MGLSVEGIEEDNKPMLVRFDPLPNSNSVHINDMPLEESTLIQKTVSMLPQLSTPTLVDRPLTGRATLGAPVSQTASEWEPIVANHLDEVRAIHAELQSETPPKAHTLEFPHLALEMLKLGLAKENQINHKLNQAIDGIEKTQKNISLLLELGSELSAAKEEDGTELSAKANEILNQLKERGIDLKKANQSVEALKRAASSRESSERSQMQIEFTTQVQRQMSQLEALHQILLQIINKDAKLKEYVIQKAGQR